MRKFRRHGTAHLPDWTRGLRLYYLSHFTVWICNEYRLDIRERQMNRSEGGQSIYVNKAGSET